MLTDLTCKTLTSLAKKSKASLKKADANGLFLFAKPNGKAYWRHKYYFQGKEKLISYGPYPLVSLSEARQQHDTSCKLLLQGKDPSKVRQDDAREAQRQANNSFKALALKWYNHNLSRWCEGYAHKLMLCMEKNLFPFIGNVPVNDLTRRQLLETVQITEGREAFYTAKRVMEIAENVLEYARTNEYIEINIAHGLKKSLKHFKRGHFPSMEIDMLPEFIARLDNNEANLSHDIRDVLELLLLTMVRPSELRKAEWSEFDFAKAIWIIPAARMKMRQTHLVPLSPRVIAILQRRKAESELEAWDDNKYVFPSRIKRNRTMDATTISNALVKMGYQNIHCPHGFRALAMGITKEKLGYRHEIPDRQLSHTAKGSVNRAYDRAKFLPERIEMMNRLAEYVENLRRPVATKWGFKVERQNGYFQPMPQPYHIVQPSA